MNRHDAPIPAGSPPVAAALALAAALILFGCAEPDKTSTQKPPTRQDIDVVLGKQGPEAEQPEAPTFTAIYRLDVLLNESAEDAWDLIDEDVFPPITKTVWNANGMRVGLMDGNKLARLTEALPHIIRVQRSALLPNHHPAVLLTTPTLRRPIIVDLTIPPRAVREVPVRGGRLQMLSLITPRSPAGTPGSGIRVELTPHHHVSQIRLIPVDPLTKQLDGRVFSELTLRAEVPASQMLIVGLHKPEPVEPGPDESTPEEDTGPVQPTENVRIAAAPDDASPQARPTDANDGEPADKEQDDGEKKQKNAEPPLPPNLGKALLTGRRLGRDIQVMLLITVEQPPATTTP